MKTKHIVLAGLACVIVFVLIGYTLGGSKGDPQDVSKVAAKLEELKKEVESLRSELSTFKRDSKGSTQKPQEAAAGEQSWGGLKVAVLSVRRVFQGCDRGANYRKQAMAEQDRIIAELDGLSKEIEAQKMDLTTLKEDSSEYMSRTKELFEKQANFQARQEFYKQQMEFKDQLWTKELYQDILRVAGDVAREKGINLVFREDEIDFSETSVAELGLAMRSHKLVYSDGCPDISDEVIARLDAGK